MYIAFIRIISNPHFEGLRLQTKTELQTNDTFKITIKAVPSNKNKEIKEFSLYVQLKFSLCTCVPKLIWSHNSFPKGSCFFLPFCSQKKGLQKMRESTSHRNAIISYRITASLTGKIKSYTVNEKGHKENLHQFSDEKSLKAAVKRWILYLSLTNPLQCFLK